MNEKNRENTARPAFDYGRYSLICGIGGLILLLFFFPSGMYFGFFLGSVGFACALVSRRINGKAYVPGFILCALCIGSSLFFFFTLLSFYDAIRDPVIGPRFMEMFRHLMEQQGIPLEQFTDIMNP